MKYTYSILLTNRIVKEQAITLRSISAIGFLMLFLVGAAFATPPVNDNFSSPMVMNGLSGQAISTTVQGTLEPLEPAHAFNKGGHSIWFKYVALGNGVLTLTTMPSSFDTTIAAYRGTTLANLVLLGSNDDTVSGSITFARSTMKIGVSTGVTYYIAVDGKYDYDTGDMPTGTVFLDYTFANSVVNDTFANAQPITMTRGSIVTSNVGATKEAGEPAHAGNPGGKSLWFKFTTTHAGSFTFTLNSTLLNANGPIDSLLAAYTGSSVDNLTLVTKSDESGVNKVVINATEFTTYYIAVDGYDLGFGASTGTMTLSFKPTKNPKVADFDQDGKADITVFRPSTGTWYALDSIKNQFRALQFGANGDKPLITDVGNDGKMDQTVFRPDNGAWYVNNSVFGFSAFSWGTNGDIPLFNTFQNQNLVCMTIFRANTGTWWKTDRGNNSAIKWGQSGDIPILADFTGDGSDDMTVFRPSNGVWYIATDLAAGIYRAVQWGQVGDIPVPADFDGDGFADIAIYRPSTGIWWIIQSWNNEAVAKQFGTATDIPQPADYDGDGRDDLAVYRGGVWWIQNANGSARAVQFGLQDDIPMASPFK